MDARPLSVAWAKSMLCFANVIFYLFFYGRLILRPWLTEVRETFTRGGPWVWIEKLLLGLFPGPPWTTGWAKKWRNLAYFQTPPANYLLSRPNAAEYCNSEKKLVKHRWLLYASARFGELWPTNPWDPRVHATAGVHPVGMISSHASV